MNKNDRNHQESMDKGSDGLKPDPKTLHTTDPQEHMEGPVSSMMQGMKEGWENASDDESAGQRKEKDDTEEKAD